MEFVANGMVCSQGHDARTACAAARAGLSRPAELPFVVVDGDGVPELAIVPAAEPELYLADVSELKLCEPVGQ